MTAGWLKSADVSAALDALASTYPTLCTRSGPGDWSAGRLGGKSGYVWITKSTTDSPAHRWPVLITGGVHARELAPPDALVSFLQKLLSAYTAGSAVTYPAWTDPVGGVVYDSFTIPWPWVRSIVEMLDVYVAPLVNDDGRDFVLTVPAGATRPQQEFHKNWRKNRRPAPSGVTDPRGAGVDLNRNFDIVWNYPTFYNTSLSNVDIRSSTNPLSELYIGDAAESEPETKNVAGLMRSKSISYFMDVHQYSRDVLYSWGIETNQSADPNMNYDNTTYNGVRDGVHNAGYKEYVPATAAAAAAAVAKQICDQILAKAGGSNPTAQTRSTYAPKQSADLYVTTGASDDYCFSRWFAPRKGGTPVSPVMAFTIEVGGDLTLGGPDNDDGGWSPDYVNNYPKLEREIHVACWTFLQIAAGTAYQAPAAPPGAPSPPASSGSGCPTLILAWLLALASVVAAVLGGAVMGGLLGGGALAVWLASRRA